MIEILTNGAHGQYVPQYFAEACDMEAWGVKPEHAAILLAGPDQEWYWETWDTVLDRAKFTDSAGVEWFLHQDGDLFAVTADDDTFAEDY